MSAVWRRNIYVLANQNDKLTNLSKIEKYGDEYHQVFILFYASSSPMESDEAFFPIATFSIRVSNESSLGCYQ
jgi:hypothetical protein